MTAAAFLRPGVPIPAGAMETGAGTSQTAASNIRAATGVAAATWLVTSPFIAVHKGVRSAPAAASSRNIRRPAPAKVRPTAVGVAADPVVGQR